MHYKDLLIAHKSFYQGETRARNYDRYMREKRQELWTTSVPKSEVDTLFKFIRSWDRFFQGDEEKFQWIYQQVCPQLHLLRSERFEDADFSNRTLKDAVSTIFNQVADCTHNNRFEATDASKILHTILPNFFVMWDRQIRMHVVGDADGKSGMTYAHSFLPVIQREITDAISTCMQERHLNRQQAIEYIRRHCDNKTLARLADEYNYVKYTLQADLQLTDKREQEQKTFHEFNERLNVLRRTNRITAKQRRDFADIWRKDKQRRPWLEQHLNTL